MKKKRDDALPRRWNTCQKMLIFRNFFVLLFFSVCFSVTLNAQAPQKTKVTLNMKDVSLNEVITALKKQTTYDFFYNSELAKSKGKISVEAKNEEIKTLLDKILPGLGLEYIIHQNLISIREKKTAPNLIQVTGKVTDEKGNPLPGATVVIHGTTRGVATDEKGNFTISTRPDDVLSISSIGYKTEVVPIKGKLKVNVGLNPTAESLDEVTVVAFGEQKKESVVSAITTVKAMDLKSSNSDLTTSFAGRIPGVIGWQTGGQPGALTEEEMNSKFYIRGITSFSTGANIDPLILLDGVESSKLDLARIAPEDIESFSVMKDASATAMYGARGANGVILVTTKKGQEGSVYATARYEAVFSQPTSDIDVVDPITYMRMYNEALMGRSGSTAPAPKYSEEKIARTGSDKYPAWLYPANDWYGMMFKDYNVNHHFGLNIRGGSKVVQYYASINHNRDQGMLKTDNLNDFSCNIKNNQTTFRINLNIDLKAGIKLVINSSTTLDKYHGPLENVQQAYGLAFAASPVDFAALYPGDLVYNWPHLRFGTSAEGQRNPYMLIQKGYLERTRYATTNRAEYIQNLSSLIKGLELRASMAMVQSGLYSTGFTTEPFRYSLVNYDFETGIHNLFLVNKTKARRTLEVDPRPDKTGSSTATRVVYEGRLMHTAAWSDHQTSLTAVFQAQEATSTPIGAVLDGMPRRNMTFSMRGSYGFKNRYFLEGSFGYNGSERFHKKNRMGFFPAIGGAWVVSSEPFMASTANWLPFLKFRATYGKVGNDGIVDKPRFVFIPTIEHLNNPKYQSPEPYGSEFNRFRVSSYANNDIQWEIAEQINLGLETKLFKGLIEFNLDAFQEIRHNILSYRTTIPSSMGLELPPLDNIGKARMRGIDFSGKLQHAFSPDLWVILNTTVTYSKTTYMEIEEATDKPSWQRKVGQEISQQVGYIAEGLFRDQAEIDNAPTQSGEGIMPGDIRYRDLNNDGTIDAEDCTYIGYPTTPRLIYGFQGFVNYKNFEFAFAFQGSGNRSFFMDPSKISPFYGDNAMLTAIYKDHWSEDNMSNKPFWPRLSTQRITYHNPQEFQDPRAEAVERRMSTYFMRECRFLRCTSLELAYSMPRTLMEKWKLQTVKFFARVNNPFIISNFKIWDVELGGSGFNYPIQKTYSVGLNLSF